MFACVSISWGFRVAKAKHVTHFCFLVSEISLEKRKKKRKRRLRTHDTDT